MHASPAFGPATEPGHYHLSVHTVSKLKGSSALAMSAYRHAELFRAEPLSVTHAAAYQRAQELGNDGKVFDYRRKIGIAWTGILAPEFTPKDLLDAQTLWNTVERIESRKNARLAREMIIALPHQVDLEIHIAMLTTFINTHLVSKGLIADVAIHRPPVEHNGDPRNWHAHVLFTDRPMTPTGFAAKKDRTLNAKAELLLWRKAWADCHNATMKHLGLPHRIDHRSLEAQRQDALQRSDTIAALDLDREPQIHVGKAHHVHHPHRTIYIDRRARNEAILIRNKDNASFRADRMRSQISDAENDAHLEGRQHALIRDFWEPEPLSAAELQAAYGRPPPITALGRLRAAAIHGDAQRRALALSREYGHPWRNSGHRSDAPSMLDLLKPMVPKTGPGHPVFTVTAKDIVFAFYSLGIIGRRELQASLENITQDEQRLFADRPTKKSKRRPAPPPPRSPPPKLPTPKADHLARLRSFAHVPEGIYLQRLAQLGAFQNRHRVKSLRKSRHLSPMLEQALELQRLSAGTRRRMVIPVSDL